MTTIKRLDGLLPTIALAGLLLAACLPEDQRTGSIDEDTWAEVQAAYSPEVKAQIDSANVAYKAADYPLALAHYQKALEADDEVAAAWFGVYMAEHAMGNRFLKGSLARIVLIDMNFIVITGQIYKPINIRLSYCMR